jgi:hypothetical protein
MWMDMPRKKDLCMILVRMKRDKNAEIWWQVWSDMRMDKGQNRWEASENLEGIFLL